MRFKVGWLNVLIFLLAVGLFGWLLMAPTLADPDAFYHIKLTQLIWSEGLPRNFPWLRFTTLAENFTDHHLMFHLASVPFVFWGGVLGAKVFALILAAGFIGLSTALLSRLGVKHSWIFGLVMLLNAPFVFRLSLVKAVPFALIIFFLGLYALLKRQSYRLFFISLFFVWSYGGWPILTVTALIFVLVRAVDKSWSVFKRALWREKKTVFAAFGGALTGLTVNPYFPGNLYFYWQQVVEIGLVNLQDKISVGSEWYPFELLYFLGNNSLVLIFLVMTTALFITRRRLLTRDHWSLAILTLIFLVMTLKSRRYVEYLVPVAVWFSALVFSRTLFKEDLSKVWRVFKAYWHTKTWRAALLVVYLLGSMIFVGARDIWSVKSRLSARFSYDHLANVSLWLKTNTLPDSLIAHSNWDDWPFLFYHNDRNYYVVGLDPTFMYNYDSTLYGDYEKFFQGTAEFDSFEFITQTLGASAVVLRSNEEESVISDKLASDERFILAYEDEEAIVYVPLINR